MAKDNKDRSVGESAARIAKGAKAGGWVGAAAAAATDKNVWYAIGAITVASLGLIIMFVVLFASLLGSLFVKKELGAVAQYSEQAEYVENTAFSGLYRETANDIYGQIAQILNNSGDEFFKDFNTSKDFNAEQLGEIITSGYVQMRDFNIVAHPNLKNDSDSPQGGYLLFDKYLKGESLYFALLDDENKHIAVTDDGDKTWDNYFYIVIRDPLKTFSFNGIDVNCGDADYNNDGNLTLDEVKTYIELSQMPDSETDSDEQTTKPLIYYVAALDGADYNGEHYAQGTLLVVNDNSNMSQGYFEQCDTDVFGLNSNEGTMLCGYNSKYAVFHNSSDTTKIINNGVISGDIYKWVDEADIEIKVDEYADNNSDKDPIAEQYYDTILNGGCRIYNIRFANTKYVTTGISLGTFEELFNNMYDYVNEKAYQEAYSEESGDDINGSKFGAYTKKKSSAYLNFMKALGSNDNVSKLKKLFKCTVEKETPVAGSEKFEIGNLNGNYSISSENLTAVSITIDLNEYYNILSLFTMTADEDTNREDVQNAIDNGESTEKLNLHSFAGYVLDSDAYEKLYEFEKKQYEKYDTDNGNTIYWNYDFFANYTGKGIGEPADSNKHLTFDTVEQFYLGMWDAGYGDAQIMKDAGFNKSSSQWQFRMKMYSALFIDPDADNEYKDFFVDTDYVAAIEAETLPHIGGSTSGPIYYKVYCTPGTIIHIPFSAKVTTESGIIREYDSWQSNQNGDKAWSTSLGSGNQINASSDSLYALYHFEDNAYRYHLYNVQINNYNASNKKVFIEADKYKFDQGDTYYGVERDEFMDNMFINGDSRSELTYWEYFTKRYQDTQDYQQSGKTLNRVQRTVMEEPVIAGCVTSLRILNNNMPKDYNYDIADYHTYPSFIFAVEPLSSTTASYIQNSSSKFGEIDIYKLFNLDEEQIVQDESGYVWPLDNSYDYSLEGISLFDEATVQSISGNAMRPAKKTVYYYKPVEKTDENGKTETVFEFAREIFYKSALSGRDNEVQGHVLYQYHQSNDKNSFAYAKSSQYPDYYVIYRDGKLVTSPQGETLYVKSSDVQLLTAAKLIDDTKTINIHKNFYESSDVVTGENERPIELNKDTQFYIVGQAERNIYDNLWYKIETYAGDKLTATGYVSAQDVCIDDSNGGVVLLADNIEYSISGFSKVYVEEGDEIEAGTVLGSFDGTLFVSFTDENGVKYDTTGFESYLGFIGEQMMITGEVENGSLREDSNGFFHTIYAAYEGIVTEFNESSSISIYNPTTEMTYTYYADDGAVIFNPKYSVGGTVVAGERIGRLYHSTGTPPVLHVCFYSKNHHTDVLKYKDGEILAPVDGKIQKIESDHTVVINSQNVFYEISGFSGIKVKEGQKVSVNDILGEGKSGVANMVIQYGQSDKFYYSPITYYGTIAPAFKFKASVYITDKNNETQTLVSKKTSKNPDDLSGGTFRTDNNDPRIPVYLMLQYSPAKYSFLINSEIKIEKRILGEESENYTDYFAIEDLGGDFYSLKFKDEAADQNYWETKDANIKHYWGTYDITITTTIDGREEKFYSRFTLVVPQHPEYDNMKVVVNDSVSGSTSAFLLNKNTTGIYNDDNGNKTLHEFIRSFESLDDNVAGNVISFVYQDFLNFVDNDNVLVIDFDAEYKETVIDTKTEWFLSCKQNDQRGYGYFKEIGINGIHAAIDDNGVLTFTVDANYKQSYDPYDFYIIARNVREKQPDVIIDTEPQDTEPVIDDSDVPGDEIGQDDVSVNDSDEEQDVAQESETSDNDLITLETYAFISINSRVESIEVDSNKIDLILKIDSNTKEDCELDIPLKLTSATASAIAKNMNFIYVEYVNGSARAHKITSVDTGYRITNISETPDGKLSFEVNGKPVHSGYSENNNYIVPMVGFYTNYTDYDGNVKQSEQHYLLDTDVGKSYQQNEEDLYCRKIIGATAETGFVIPYGDMSGLTIVQNNFIEVQQPGKTNVFSYITLNENGFAIRYFVAFSPELKDQEPDLANEAFEISIPTVNVEANYNESAKQVNSAVQIIKLYPNLDYSSVYAEEIHRIEGEYNKETGQVWHNGYRLWGSDCDIAIADWDFSLGAGATWYSEKYSVYLMGKTKAGYEYQLYGDNKVKMLTGSKISITDKNTTKKVSCSIDNSKDDGTVIPIKIKEKGNKPFLYLSVGTGNSSFEFIEDGDEWGSIIDSSSWQSLWNELLKLFGASVTQQEYYGVCISNNNLEDINTIQYKGQNIEFIPKTSVDDSKAADLAEHEIKSGEIVSSTEFKDNDNVLVWYKSSPTADSSVYCSYKKGIGLAGGGKITAIYSVRKQFKVTKDGDNVQCDILNVGNYPELKDLLSGWSQESITLPFIQVKIEYPNGTTITNEYIDGTSGSDEISGKDFIQTCEWSTTTYFEDNTYSDCVINISNRNNIELYKSPFAKSKDKNIAPDKIIVPNQIVSVSPILRPLSSDLPGITDSSWGYYEIKFNNGLKECWWAQSTSLNYYHSYHTEQNDRVLTLNNELIFTDTGGRDKIYLPMYYSPNNSNNFKPACPETVRTTLKNHGLWDSYKDIVSVIDTPDDMRLLEVDGIRSIQSMAQANIDGNVFYYCTIKRHGNPTIYGWFKADFFNKDNIWDIAMNEYNILMNGNPAPPNNIREVPKGFNNVKYNTWWYGKEVYEVEVNGNKYAWCAVFVNWCAKQADVYEYVPHKAGAGYFLDEFFTSTNEKLSSSRYFGSYWYGDTYDFSSEDAFKPQPGDLIFYTNGKESPRQGKLVVSHVGIVYSRNGYEITTVEGNVGDAVDIRRKNLLTDTYAGVVKNGQILGFARLACYNNN